MNPNPYQPPAAYQAPVYPGAVAAPAINKTPFILAAVGAWLASGYWALMTMLIGVGVFLGAGSGVQIILPCVLIALYAVRGFQLLKGDPAAARRILWLHGVGAVAALVQAMAGGGILAVLQGMKVVINIFGAIAAYAALRSYTEAVSRGAVPSFRAP
jgi:hypothetical protein